VAMVLSPPLPNESPATPDPEQSVNFYPSDESAEWIAVRRAAQGRPFVVAVAGPAGSGKSTFASWLAAVLAAVLIPQDDFCLDPACRLRSDVTSAYDMDGFREVVESIVEGRRARYVPYDPIPRCHHGLRELEPSDTIVIDGVTCLLDPYVRSIADVAVFVTAQWDRRVARQVIRHIKEGRCPNESLEAAIDRFLIRVIDEPLIESQKYDAHVIIETDRQPAFILWTQKAFQSPSL
jgi:uridine kinase